MQVSSVSGEDRAQSLDGSSQRAIERELYLASRASVTRTRFESSFLRRLLDVSGADGVALWHDPGGDALYLFQQVDFPINELREDVDAWTRHGRLLRLVEAGCGQRYAPLWTNGAAENPTD